PRCASAWTRGTRSASTRCASCLPSRRIAGTSGLRSGSARGGRIVIDRTPQHLEEDFVVANHAELVASPFLDGAKPFLQITDLRIERTIARGQPVVDGPLLLELAVDVPHARPAALAEPEAVLQGGYERKQQR